MSVCRSWLPVHFFPYSLRHRIQAAIYFKNNLSKRWCLNCKEYDTDNPEVVIAVPVNEDEKNQLRARLIPLMASSQDVIARQFVECTWVVHKSNSQV